MNTYEPEWNYGPAFFDARHNFVVSANYELPYGSWRLWAATPQRPWMRSSAAGGWAASSRRDRASQSR